MAVESGVFEVMVHDLHMLPRLAERYAEQPSTALFSTSGPCHPAWKVVSKWRAMGRSDAKEGITYMAVDALWDPLAVHVTRANEQNRAQDGRDATSQAVDMGLTRVLVAHRFV